LLRLKMYTLGFSSRRVGAMCTTTYAAVRLANNVSIELPFESHCMKGKGQDKCKTGTSMWELRGADKPSVSIVEMYPHLIKLGVC
jgi:hypothetical protein